MRKRTEHHGQYGSSVYQAWSNMIQRCYNPKNPRYPLYGGRGITVCKRWRKSFAAFARDMGPKPSPKHSIDRFPDNNSGYRPSNCRWATATEQRNNTRPRSSRKLIAFEGGLFSFRELSNRTGVNELSLRHRYSTGLRGKALVDGAFKQEVSALWPAPDNAERRRLVKLWRSMDIPGSFIAKLLGITHQRVYQIETGPMEPAKPWAHTKRAEAA